MDLSLLGAIQMVVAIALPCKISSGKGSRFTPQIGAFAAILADGSVVTWGYPYYGGDSVCRAKSAQERAAGSRRKCLAFAAILADGSVVTWGHPDIGGDSSAVQDQLRNVQQVHATSWWAFAASLADGSVVTWGQSRLLGGDSSAVQDQLRNVQQVHATDLAHLLQSCQMDLSLLGATHMMVAIALPCKISSGICRKGQGNLMVHLLLKPSMVGW